MSDGQTNSPELEARVQQLEDRLNVLYDNLAENNAMFVEAIVETLEFLQGAGFDRTNLASKLRNICQGLCKRPPFCKARERLLPPPPE